MASRAGHAMNLRRCAVQRRPHRRSAHAENEIPVAVPRVDRRLDNGGPARQPLRRTDLTDSMFGRPCRRGRGAFGCSGPLPRASRCRRGTRLGEILVVQLTKLDALSLFGESWIARSVARASSVTSFTSLLLALRFVRCNHRRRLAPERMQALQVPLEVLSRMIVGPS